MIDRTGMPGGPSGSPGDRVDRVGEHTSTPRSGLGRADLWPLGAIGFVLSVSVAWWGLALWRLPGSPEWLERARSVCFNLDDSGLPDAKGWLLLVGQPPAMLAVLVVGWKDEVFASLARLVSRPRGRLGALALGVGLITGVALSVGQVLDARVPPPTFQGDEAAGETYPRLDRTWPHAEGLLDQSGERFDLDRLGGGPALVTFAFGHCATLCPVVVHQARAVGLASSARPAVVVLTLDPWRDTPSRLPDLVTQFQLDPSRDFVVGGSAADVNAALDAWNVPRERDMATGDIVHPALVYFVEADGTIAYASSGGIEQMTSLADRLR